MRKYISVVDLQDVVDVIDVALTVVLPEVQVVVHEFVYSTIVTITVPVRLTSRL